MERSSPASWAARTPSTTSLDVATREAVDECHRILNDGKHKWGLKKITTPADQHGTYSWMFSQGRDLAAWGAGKGDDVNPNQYKR